MDFHDVVHRRRMIRRFRSDAVPDATVRSIVEAGLRAPSAGFSQGWDFVVLSGREQVDGFWAATAADEPPDAWLEGVASAPVLIVCCSDRDRYLRRYAQADKPWQDRSRSHWPVAYWDVDTGMAAMIMLLAAVDHGLGALFFGVPVEALDAVRAALDIPGDRGIVGVIALGSPASTRPSGSTRTRRRRPTAEVVHSGRFGRPLAGPG